MEHHTVLAKGRKLLPPNLGLLLTFVGGDEQGRLVPLLFERTILGRKSGDIIVRDSQVSSMHAAIEFEAGAFRVVDLGSSNGTYVKGERIKQAYIGLEDDVRLGNTLVRLKHDPAAAAQLAQSLGSRMHASVGGLTELLDREFIESDAKTAVAHVPRPGAAPLERYMRLQLLGERGPGKILEFNKPQVSLGRVSCDVVLPDPDVSRKHALLEFAEGGQVIVRDLASSNGTFVNEIRISDKVLEEGDLIRIGQSRLTFLGVKLS